MRTRDVDRSGGVPNDVRRRRLLGSAATAVTAASAGCTGGLDLLGQSHYESVRVHIDADGIVWSGEVSFKSDDGTRVTIPVDRALGTRTYVLPDDIDADGYDVVVEPLVVNVTPERGVSSNSPVTLTVHCDGDRCGRATATDADETAEVRVD
jgi:hypothetical protein